MNWVELRRDLMDHPRLHQLHGLVAKDWDVDLVRAKLENIWLWAVKHVSYDGIVNGIEPGDKAADLFARVARWSGDPNVWYEGLLKSGWLEEVDGKLRLNDWMRMAGKYQLRRIREMSRNRAWLSITRGAQAPVSWEVPESLKSLPLFAADWRLCLRWEDLYKDWVKAFPMLDVLEEVRKAHIWAMSNPIRIRRNQTRFLIEWLFEAARKCGGGNHFDSGNDSSGPVQMDPSAR